MTTVKISEPSLLLALQAHLTARIDCMASALTDDTLKVTVLGSYRVDSMDVEAKLRISTWEKAQRARGFRVRVDFD